MIGSFPLTDLLEVLGEYLWVRIGLIVVVLVAAQWLVRLWSGRIIYGILKRRSFHSDASREQRSNTLSVVFRRTSAAMLWIVGVGLVLTQFNVNWAGLAAGAGVIGIVVGLGAQKVAGDFIAGFFILLENQYDIGDVIEVGDKAYGTVERIDLRTTHIRNLDGGLHIIANSEIVNMANHSAQWATALVYVWLKNGTDIQKVEKIMNRIGHDFAKDEEWGEELRGTIGFNRLEDFGADGMKVRALGDTAPGMQWAVAGEYRRRLLQAFTKEGIEVAYPQRVITNDKKS